MTVSINIDLDKSEGFRSYGAVNPESGVLMTILVTVNGVPPWCFKRTLHLSLFVQYTLLSFRRTFSAK